MRATAPLLLGAVVALAAWPASAGGPPISSVLTPPKAYQGDAIVSVQFIDPETVPALCRALGARLSAGVYPVACTTGRTLILPNPCTWPNHSDYQRLACHELSHANGWPADHSDPTKAR